MIGGKVLDPSVLAEFVEGSIAMEAWLDVAATQGVVFFVPSLAVGEVRAVYPDRSAHLRRLVDHSQVVVRELTHAEAPVVAKLLADARCFDAAAGHVILVARQRGWPVLTADPGRLQRIAPDLDLDLL